MVSVWLVDDSGGEGASGPVFSTKARAEAYHAKLPEYAKFATIREWRVDDPSFLGPLYYWVERGDTGLIVRSHLPRDADLSRHLGVVRPSPDRRGYGVWLLADSPDAAIVQAEPLLDRVPAAVS